MVLERNSLMESITTKRKSGYEVQLIEPLPDQLKCPLCKKLIRDPIQTNRGELACAYCYQLNKKENICPIDQEPILNDVIHRDKCQEKTIQKLRCYCVYKLRGCEWDGIVAEVENHQSVCGYAPTKCCFCKNEIDGQDNHLIECPYLINRDTCFYRSMGCPFKPRCIEDLVSHIKKATYQHLYLQQNIIDQSKIEYESEKNELQVKTNLAKETKTHLEYEIGNLTEEVEKMKKQMQEVHDNVRIMARSLTEVSSRAVAGAVCDYKSNGKHENSDQLTNVIAGMNAKLSLIELKQQLTENTTYDGKILWKIDKFTHRMQQAVTGAVTALHSAPCFTSRYGYKICGRLYLNGDGMGKCSHLSLFLVVMRSEYDNMLEWPFQKHVVFRLINQEDCEKSIQESFLPDDQSSSFQKPVHEMNVAAGCPLFIAREKLLSGGFVKDNSIFIEISAK